MLTWFDWDSLMYQYSVLHWACISITSLLSAFGLPSGSQQDLVPTRVLSSQRDYLSIIVHHPMYGSWVNPFCMWNWESEMQSESFRVGQNERLVCICTLVSLDCRKLSLSSATSRSCWDMWDVLTQTRVIYSFQKKWSRIWDIEFLILLVYLSWLSFFWVFCCWLKPEINVFCMELLVRIFTENLDEYQKIDVFWPLFTVALMREK